VNDFMDCVHHIWCPLFSQEFQDLPDGAETTLTSEDAVVAARRSRVEWENRQRKKQGLDTLGMDELIAKAWRFVRERFRSYQTELKSRGIKRARARRDANRERQDIVTLVKRQLTREISEGRFTANREAVKREVERRVKERMILSRNRNYSRLATASP
ncbi:plasmid replication initiator RepA, partial [Escherichia coli]